MPLLAVRGGFTGSEPTPVSTTTTGNTITASSTIHTKGSWTQLINGTASPAYGIWVFLDNSATSNTATSMLCDIGIGAASSEVVLIPDLACGYALPEATAGVARCYFFPIYIPANSRLSARLQSLIASDTINCRIRLMYEPKPGEWAGSRVTAYGVTSASSKGTDVTTSTTANVYSTAVAMSGSTANPIKALQIGIQGGARATLVDRRIWGEVRLGASTAIASALVMEEDTGTESMSEQHANEQLAGMRFNLPAGQDLRVALMHNLTTAVAIDCILYGVD